MHIHLGMSVEGSKMCRKKFIKSQDIKKKINFKLTEWKFMAGLQLRSWALVLRFAVLEWMRLVDPSKGLRAILTSGELRFHRCEDE